MAWRIALRLRHPGLAREHLDAAVGRPSDTGWSPGEARRTPRGEPLEGVRTEGYATYPLVQGEGQDLAAGLERALEAIEPRAAALAALGPTLRREVFVGWFLREGLGGDELQPALLRRLAALDLTLSFDLYGG